ncbi:alpha/beta fold hydrolase [Candidatus Kaiserbacteria bacterium]|nr:alpha/beta fold hydrolase [Candidatus Kaiserbacteria bacterium]
MRVERKIGKENAKYKLRSEEIDVGEGQKLYVIEWGNPKGKPFICLHGGPGASFNESHVALFNGETDHVIFFDQRGCGESTPSAAKLTTEQLRDTNTPTHLVRDMEHLRLRFDMQKMNIVAGSWGSSLASFYAIEHPDRVASLQLWSLYLANRKQAILRFEDKTREPGFPQMCVEPWKEFIALIPESERGYDKDGLANPVSIMNYCASAKGVNNPDEKIARKFAEAYLIYEYTLCQPDGSDTDPKGTMKKIRKLITDDPNTLSAARLEITYKANDTFVEDDHIFKNIEKLKGIPITIVQGKRDWCTPTRFARMLEEKLGVKCVEEVDSGHLRTDKEMKKRIEENIRRAPMPPAV